MSVYIHAYDGQKKVDFMNQIAFCETKDFANKIMI